MALITLSIPEIPHAAYNSIASLRSILNGNEKDYLVAFRETHGREDSYCSIALAHAYKADKLDPKRSHPLAQLDSKDYSLYRELFEKSFPGAKIEDGEIERLYQKASKEGLVSAHMVQILRGLSKYRGSNFLQEMWNIDLMERKMLPYAKQGNCEAQFYFGKWLLFDRFGVTEEQADPADPDYLKLGKEIALEGVYYLSLSGMANFQLRMHKEGNEVVQFSGLVMQSDGTVFSRKEDFEKVAKQYNPQNGIRV